MDGISLTKKLRENPKFKHHAHPDPDHRVQRRDEPGGSRCRRHRLARQTLRPGKLIEVDRQVIR